MAAVAVNMAALAPVSSFLGARVAPSVRRVSAKAPVSVRRASFVVRAEAPAKVDRSGDTLWFASPQSLSYLDGSLPGDFGFDPLGLSDPEGAGGFITPEWLRYAEIINGRWAMLGAAGMLAPEVFGKIGIIPQSTALTWFKAGSIPPQGSFEYWANAPTLFWTMLLLFNFVEVKRWADYQNPGSQANTWFLGLEGGFKGTGDPAYPGGIFNPFGFGADKTTKTKEVKNGRLAMLAVLGFFLQAMITGKGPLENLSDHLSNPTGANILTGFGSIPPLSF